MSSISRYTLADRAGRLHGGEHETVEAARRAAGAGDAIIEVHYGYTHTTMVEAPGGAQEWPPAGGADPYEGGRWLGAGA